MIKKTLHLAELVPPSGDLQGPAMRPLFLLLRLDKIPLYDKTFELNPLSFEPWPIARIYRGRD
jgi:hypothetical protein